MQISRRMFMGSLVAGYTTLGSNLSAQSQSNVKHYVRFQYRDRISCGQLIGRKVFELKGSIFEQPARTGKTYSLDEVKLLVPCEPTKILAAAGNYISHLAGERPRPKNPEFFFKVPSALLDPEGMIVIPPGTSQCDFEGELVIVIGKKAKNLSVAEASNYVFGITCGNDISARDWQKNDIQWWRAKGSDTFAPLGPAIAQGLNYDNLMLTTRVNGQIKQQQRTKDLIFNVHSLVSFASRFVTLYPGDVIYTGTPGQTSALKSGDVVEVEIEGIGILKNTVA